MASAAAKQPKADVHMRDQDIEYFNQKILDTYQKISSILKVPLYILFVHNPRGIGRIVVTISVLDDPISTMGGMPSIFNEDNGDSGYILKPGPKKEILTSAHGTDVVENENSICNICGERARFNFSFIIERKVWNEDWEDDDGGDQTGIREGELFTYGNGVQCGCWAHGSANISHNGNRLTPGLGTIFHLIYTMICGSHMRAGRLEDASNLRQNSDGTQSTFWDRHGWSVPYDDALLLKGILYPGIIGLNLTVDKLLRTIDRSSSYLIDDKSTVVSTLQSFKVSPNISTADHSATADDDGEKRDSAELAPSDIHNSGPARRPRSNAFSSHNGGRRKRRKKAKQRKNKKTKRKKRKKTKRRKRKTKKR